MKSKFIIILFVCIIAGCTPAIIGTTVATSAVIIDRRSSGAIADDTAMELNIATKVYNLLHNKTNKNDNNDDISVISYNRNILLLGHVKNKEIATEVERIAKSQTASKNVYNYININKDRSFTGLANDSWITSKIRTNMLKAPKELSFNNVKIKTYAGVTYIMGILTPKEQEKINYFISTIPGVKKLVTFYEDLNLNNDK